MRKVGIATTSCSNLDLARIQPVTTRGPGRGAAVVQSRASREQNQAIREWAAKNGYEVSECGRIPAAIVDAFHSKR